MDRSVLIMAVCSIVLLCFSCREKSANPGPEGPVSFSYQSGKCLGHDLPKSAVSDSSFNYSFSDKLVIDFSVTANCCPDSNRFTVSSFPGPDTIVVAVIDTAQNLCKCLCPYTIHAEFGNLTNDHYVICCTLGEPQGQGDRIYIVDVFRK